MVYEPQDELLGRFVSERSVRPSRVVVHAAGFDDLLGFLKREELVLVPRAARRGAAYVPGFITKYNFAELHSSGNSV